MAADTINIRLIRDGELSKVCEMIKSTCETCWVNYYPKSSIDYVLKNELDFASLEKTTADAHFYVAVLGDEVVGCGGIKKKSPSDCEIFTVFVSHEHQGKGIGKSIMDTLEKDEIALQAKRIEIPSSVLALPFYKKRSYEHKNWPNNYSLGTFTLEKEMDK